MNDKNLADKKFLSTSSEDLIVLAITVVLVLCVSYFLNVFYVIVEFITKHPHSIYYVDEILTGFLTVSLGLAIFAWRRWLELKKETAERIKLQDELLRAAETNVSIEKIISKQLRSDMENLKQDVREIRLSLVKKTSGRF